MNAPYQVDLGLTPRVDYAGLYVYDYDPDRPGVIRLRDLRQDREVEVVVEVAFWDSIRDAYPLLGAGTIPFTPQPWQVTGGRTLDWHEYRRGLHARND